jgi:hypothetical protein
MDDALYEDRSSSIILTIHVMVIVAIAAKQRRRVFDIKNAFLLI